MMEQQQIAPTPGVIQMATEAALWSTYILRRSDTGAVIYAGRSRQPEIRLKHHLESASGPARRSQQAVSGVIHELSLQGTGITLEVVAEGLGLDAAKRAEGQLLQDLRKAGAPLANTRQLDGGKGGVVLRSTQGTAERRAENREYSRARYATPEGYRRELVRCALTDLRKGRPLSPMRRYHITTAGPDFIDKARAILAARGEVWPME